MNPYPNLVDSLAKSQLFHDFHQAFTDTTGLPLTLRPVDSWRLPFHNKKNESRFCAAMAGKSRSCASCLQVQQSLSDAAINEPHTTQCDMGMSETAVPVRMGDTLVGYLQTGQLFQRAPSMAQFDRAAKLVSEWGLEMDVAELKSAYLAMPVIPHEQYQATVDMLKIFADHLALVGNQMIIREKTSEPPVITRAKQFIEDHHSEDLALEQVAKAANMSMFYFCKTFKKTVGINFTEYPSQVRVKKAKNLLLNRELRISEIAYEVGFQSLTHFNRVFKKVVGTAPSAYRDQLPRGGA